MVACFDILRILTRVEGIAAESVLKSFDREYISQTPFTCWMEGDRVGEMVEWHKCDLTRKLG